MNIVVYLILAWYFDKVVPNDNGSSLHPLFFLFPATYGSKNPDWLMKFLYSNQPAVQSNDVEDENEDVVQERKLAARFNPDVQRNPDAAGIRLVELRKEYESGLRATLAWMVSIGLLPRSLLSAKRATTKVAIHGLSLVVEKGEMLALLGSNGAGKTSLASFYC